MEIERYTFDDSMELIANGSLIDTKTVVGVALAASRLGGA
jgi:hypothetical protein